MFSRIKSISAVRKLYVVNGQTLSKTGASLIFLISFRPGVQSRLPSAGSDLTDHLFNCPPRGTFFYSLEKWRPYHAIRFKAGAASAEMKCWKHGVGQKGDRCRHSVEFKNETYRLHPEAESQANKWFEYSVQRRRLSFLYFGLKAVWAPCYVIWLRQGWARRFHGVLIYQFTSNSSTVINSSLQIYWPLPTLHKSPGLLKRESGITTSASIPGTSVMEARPRRGCSRGRRPARPMHFHNWTV